MLSEIKVNIRDIIAPSFYNLHCDLKEDLYTHYWLKGGRGSGKSSFISLEIIYGIMKDTQANAVILRKFDRNLRGTVFNQTLWAINMLRIGHLFKTRNMPLEIEYIATGQKIIFVGMDDPEKIKSTKFVKGYCKYIWYEEASQFRGMEEIRSINQSLIRGGPTFTIFYSYNPPESQRSWVNSESIVERSDRIVHHSDYRKVPPEWLGDQFFIEANYLKKIKPLAYQHEYLGEVIGTGGQIFKNLFFEKITDDEIDTFDKIKRGLDFGYAADPLHYLEAYFDKARKRLYIFAEIHQVELKNERAVEKIKEINKVNGIITADCAEPRTIAHFRDLGLRINPAKKGADSVHNGIKYLQDMEAIIIDSVRCPNTAREFYEYELIKDKEGNFKANYPDKNNHSIDACRYALEEDIRMKRSRTRGLSELFAD